MTYIILIAGTGSRLHPITNEAPKTLYRLDAETTVLKRMVTLIRKYDQEADIILVTGFKHEKIEAEIQDVTIYYNPFYYLTNSIASLWFAQEKLQGNVTLINGDVVISGPLAREVITQKTEKPIVLMDSSIKTDGDYNVQVSDKSVVVISKELEYYDGEYAGITKLDPETSQRLKQKINDMIDKGYCDQWYENALVEMVFFEDLELGYVDIADYQWTEVDSVNDLRFARKIHQSENRGEIQ